MLTAFVREGALRLSFECAERAGAPLVVANDPDSDRLAVAERAGPGWRVFSGNEVGTLLAHWLLVQHRLRHPGADPRKLLFVNTVVSSKMICAIARKEGIRYEECLTGFKWIGDLSLRLAKEEGCILLLGFEQAIGYMVRRNRAFGGDSILFYFFFCVFKLEFQVGDVCPDKDGIRTAAVLGEMADHLYSVKKTTLAGHLDSIYDQYGYMAARDSYFFCYDPKRMFAIFDEMKLPDGTYPTHMGKYQISRVRDLKSPV